MNYPIGDTAQHFIFACRRAAARIDVSQQEMQSYRASDERSNSIEMEEPAMNVVSIIVATPIRQMPAKSHSA